ncbi:Cytochrome b561 and DOMON domain-containing protein, partial [Mucuna pruriens]
MASTQNPLLMLLTFFTAIIVPVAPQPCNSYTFPNNMNYAACRDLPVLESSLHWNYDPSLGAVNVAFTKANVKDSSWVAWAINPTSKGMVGSQAFVALHKSNGSIKAYTSSITTYATTLQESNLTFSVYNVSASYTNGSMIIFATFQLPANKTLVNHVWQEGLVSNDSTLKAHSFSQPNLQSFGTLDFLSRKVSEHSGNVNSQATLRNVRKLDFILSRSTNLSHIESFTNLDCTTSSWNFEYHKLGNTNVDLLHPVCQSLAFLISIVGLNTGLYIENHYGVLHSNVLNFSTFKGLCDYNHIFGHNIVMILEVITWIGVSNKKRVMKSKE